MKSFVKMTLATVAGLLIFGVVSFFLLLGMVGTVAALGEKHPVMPKEGILKIDMSSFVLGEQTQESDPISMLQGSATAGTLGTYDAIKAINYAATDPAVKFIYMRPDGSLSGTAHVEELRTALRNFRSSGKPIISYIEGPSTSSYYLASVSDKIYMTAHDGATSTFLGMSSQMIFLKDILDRLGVNVQLIRHGKYKSAGEMYVRSSSSKENMEQNEEMIKSSWESWVKVMAEARGVSVEDLNSIIDNLELNFPTDWLEKGLVDELVTLDGLEQKLCSLYGAEKYEDVKGISLLDYSKLRNTVNFKADAKVAVIYTDGNIVDGGESQQVAGDRFAKIISDVRKDSTIKAVVLRVNSPGGSVLASEKIKAELDLLRKDKALIASYGDYAASGGYWISANCDKIYSNATTLTGSIGVFSMIPDISGTLKNKIHVNLTSVNSNEHTDMYSMTRPLTDKEVAYMQASVENIYDKFTALVAAGRGMDVPSVDAIAQGRVWTGADAVKIGLVDEIGTIEDAVSYAVLSVPGVSGVEDVQVVAYPKPLTKLDMIMETLGGSENIFAGTALENVGEAFLDWNSTEAGKVYARMPYEIVVR